MAKSRFFDAAGWLTGYAMACGYRHATDISKDESVILYRLECDGAVYGVEHWKRGAVGATDASGATLRDGLAYRETFRSAGAARRAYKRRTGASLARRYESAPDVQRHVYA